MDSALAIPGDPSPHTYLGARYLIDGSVLR
jgi:hypothetical protein